MIKKTLLLFFIASMLFFSKGMAQSNAFKINIISPVVKTASVFYERALNDQSSLQLGFYYTGASVDDTKFQGFGITPEYRFYLSETAALEGVYVGPFVRYSNVDLSDGGDEGTLSSFGGGLVIGKQWVFKERVALDIFFGPKYVNAKVDVTSGEEGSFETGVFDGFGLRAGILLGIAF